MVGEELSTLPPNVELETKEILKSVAAAHRYLAELKVYSETIPDPSVNQHPNGATEPQHKGAT